MTKVWLVTGTGSGLGRDIVIASARRLTDPDTLLRDYGERLVPMALDVRDE